MDIWSREKRSEVMARIRSRDTKPELMVRSLRHRAGFRFSLRRRHLPGKPDIVLPKYGAVIFVHGCFWHRHKNCRAATMPKSRSAYWQAKFSANVARDQCNQRALKREGWKVIVLWECQVLRDPWTCLETIIARLCLRSAPLDYDDLPSRSSLIKTAESRLQWNLRGNVSKPEGSGD